MIESEHATYLLVAVGTEPGGRAAEHRVAARVVTVGRAPDNDIVLASPRVSGHHARLVRTDAGYAIEDLESKNGTWINERRVAGGIALTEGDLVRVGDLTLRFMRESGPTLTLDRASRVPRVTVTVLFADLEGHTALFERLGTEAVHRLLVEYLSLMKAHVACQGGRTVKTEGDGLIASFATVRQAVDCAIDIQRGMGELTPVGDKPVPVRIGINSGEALKDEEDLIGLAVVKAARIMGHARGGEILLSQISRSLLGPATGVSLVARGWYELKGLSRKERLFEVTWR